MDTFVELFAGFFIGAVVTFIAMWFVMRLLPCLVRSIVHHMG